VFNAFAGRCAHELMCGHGIDTIKNGIRVGVDVANHVNDDVDYVKNWLPVDLVGEIRHDRAAYRIIKDSSDSTTFGIGS
jgi:hypothetical protein